MLTMTAAGQALSPTVGSPVSSRSLCHGTTGHRLEIYQPQDHLGYLQAAGPQSATFGTATAIPVAGHLGPLGMPVSGIFGMFSFDWLIVTLFLA